MTLLIHRGEGPGFPYAGQQVHVLAGHQGQPPGFAAMELTIPARFAGPIPHAHDEFDEAIYVLRGQLLVAGEDEPQQAVAGSMFVAARGHRHGFSNPYPIILLFGGKWLLIGKDRRALTLAVTMGAATAFAQVWYWLFWRLGIHARQDGAFFASPPAAAHNLQVFCLGALDLFSANFFGHPILSAQSLGLEFNLLILVGTLLSPLLLLHREVRKDVWKSFLVLQPLFVTVSFIVASKVVDVASERYLIMLPFYGALIFAVVTPGLLAPRPRNVLTAIFLLGITLNVASTAPIYLNRGDSPNADNQNIARIAQAHHLTRGYASYWDASINQFYADNKILFIQAGCSRTSGVKPYRLLLNEQVLTRQAASSFYLFDPTATRCTETDLARYFGQPRSSVDVGGGKRLLVYGYDISTKINAN